MKHFISLFILYFFFIQTTTAQNNTNNVVMDSQGNEMLPFVKGKITVQTFYDENYTNSFPQELINLYEEKFTTLVNAFSKHDILNPPTGFEVQLNKRISVWKKHSVPDFFFPNNDPKTVADLEIAFSPYFKIDNQPIVDFHNSSIFSIYLNNPYNIAGSPILSDIYPCPQKVDSFHGFPVYQTNRSEVTIINLTKKPFFIPVSQEEFIHTNIAYWKNEIEKDRQDEQEYKNEVAEQQSSDEKKQRQQDFEQAYQELLKYDKNAAEELKKAFHEAEQVIMGNVNENTTGADVFKNSISLKQSQIVLLEEKLAAMSETEKQQQAFYSAGYVDETNGVSGLLPQQLKHEGDALVRINPNLVADNPTNIQLVTIHWDLMDNDFSDRPREAEPNEDAGFLTDNKMLSLYNDSSFWKNIVHLMKQEN